MLTLKSYLCGEWKTGEGEGATLLDPTTEAPIATASTQGLDFAEAMRFAREEGGPALRALTFAERGAILKKLSKDVYAKREELIEDSIRSGGTTRKGAKFDIDGATATLAYYANLGKTLGDKRVLVEGEGEVLARSPRFVGYHIKTPRHGVAMHINAFNFPTWGMCEKLGCAILAGMPVISKPATSTALLAYRVVEAMVAADVLPKGAFQFVCGSAGDMVSHLGPQDVLAFTGSADTGARLRATPNVIANSVRINVEADSLNAAVLGTDVEEGSDTWHLFLRHVITEVMQKSGQKCTAIRRVFVPASRIDVVQEGLLELFSELKVGAPGESGIDIGPLATASQLQDAKDGVVKLLQSGAKAVFGDVDKVEMAAGEAGKGWFFPPMLLRADAPKEANAVHSHEVFGPVTTLMPYDDAAQAGELVALGGGGLVCSVYSDDKTLLEEVVLAVAPYSGRVFAGSQKIADAATTPGMVLPSCIHGGPGRAGGGEELGGERGLSFYMQRTAVQGDRGIFDRAFGLR